MKQITVVEHPLVQHNIARCRSAATETWQFRSLVEEITMFLVYEATRCLPVVDVDLFTPVAAARGRELVDETPLFVPVLRAGLGMVPGVLRLFPKAPVGHIGLYRDHTTHDPVEYYCNLPAFDRKKECFLLEPMLATGGSAAHAVDLLKRAGLEKITLLSLIAAPEGIEAVTGRHGETRIFLAALDEGLNEKAYIVPGLGDAGDRIFGTT